MASTEEWIPAVEQVGGDQTQRLGYIRGLMAQGRSQEAIAELGALLGEDPDNVQALLAMALQLQRQGQFEDAAAQCERAMAIEPRNPAAPLLAAYVGVNGNNPEYAETNFHRALIANPRSLPALLGLARLHQGQHKPQAAVEALDRAAAIDPQSTQVMRQLATALTQLDRTSEAKALLQKGLVLQPGNAAIALQLSGLCTDLGARKEALETLEGALASTPDSRVLQIALGRLKLDAADWVGAEEVLTQAATSEEGGIIARLALVEALIPQSKLREAREVLGRVPRHGGYASAVHKLYGDVFEKEGKTDDAIASYRAALMHMREGDAALEQVDKALRSVPSDSEQALTVYKGEIDKRQAEMRQHRRERRGPPEAIQQNGRPFLALLRRRRRQGRAGMGQGAAEAADASRWGGGRPGPFNRTRRPIMLQGAAPMATANQEAIDPGANFYTANPQEGAGHLNLIDPPPLGEEPMHRRRGLFWSRVARHRAQESRD